MNKGENEGVSRERSKGKATISSTKSLRQELAWQVLRTRRMQRQQRESGRD